MQIILFIFYSILAGFLNAPVDQKVEFDILRGNKIVGKLEATKSVQADRTVYTSYTEASMRMVKRITVKYEFEVVMKDGVLFQSDANITVNGKLHAHSQIRTVGNQYELIRNKKKDHTTTLIDHPIYYPAILLLFQEPKEFVASFSEEDGHFHQLNRISEHGYEKTSPKGRTNEYFFHEDVLQEANLDAGFFQFKVMRKLK